MLSSVVYVYKLIYYSCFDFQKSYLQTNILLIQGEVSSSNEQNNFFTYFKLFAFVCVFLYSVFFFVIVKLYILKQYNFFNHLPNTLVNELSYLNLTLVNSNYFIKIFYLLFTTSIFTLFLNSWRTNYFFLSKCKLISQIFFFFFFLTLINFFFKYFLLLI